MKPAEETTDFSLPKREILRGKRSFEYLFKHGSAMRIGVLKFYYLFDAPSELVQSSLTVAFSVPKRLHKRAVARNLLKRRLREGYRLQKAPLIDLLDQKQKNLILLIIYTKPYKANYHQMARAIRKALAKLAEEVK